MELWWIGQSGFRLRDPGGETVIFIDPFLSEHKGRTWECPASVDDLARANLVLCTHEHIDHFDQPALKAAATVPGSRFILVVPRPIVETALALGLPPDRIIGTQPGDVIQWDNATIFPVPAVHGVGVADAYNFGEQLSNGEVRYLGYVIEMAGVRAYHAGDCIPYEGQIETLRRLSPQVALLPINGRDFFRERDRNIVGNMTPREAVIVTDAIGAHTLVPMHWELFPHNPGYPDEVVQIATQDYPSMNILIFGRGQKITLT